MIVPCGSGWADKYVMMSKGNARLSWLGKNIMIAFYELPNNNKNYELTSASPFKVNTVSIALLPVILCKCGSTCTFTCLTQTKFDKSIPYGVMIKCWVVRYSSARCIMGTVLCFKMAVCVPIFKTFEVCSVHFRSMLTYFVYIWVITKWKRSTRYFVLLSLIHLIWNGG